MYLHVTTRKNIHVYQYAQEENYICISPSKRLWW